MEEHKSVQKDSEMKIIIKDNEMIEELKRVMTDGEIIEEMNQRYNTCTECGSGVFNTLKLWSDKAVCNECYYKKKDELSSKIEEYIEEKGYNACKFCG